jgi:hypothetical protein
MRAMLAGATNKSPAKQAEPKGAASKIDISQIWSFAPTMRFPRMRNFLRLLVDCRSIRLASLRSK